MMLSRRNIFTLFIFSVVSFFAFTNAIPMPSIKTNTTVLKMANLKPVQAAASFRNFKYIPDDVYNALRSYTKEGGAGSANEINNYLRGITNGTESTKIAAGRIHNFLKNSKTTSPMKVYRGSIDWLGGTRVAENGRLNFTGNRIAADKGFTSTSYNMTSAKRIANQRAAEINGPTVKFLEEIELPVGTHGWDLSAIRKSNAPFSKEFLSHYPNEMEFLLDKGTNRLITGFSAPDADGFILVYSRVITEAEAQALRKSSKLVAKGTAAITADGVLMTKSAQEQFAKLGKKTRNRTLKNSRSIKKSLSNVTKISIESSNPTRIPKIMKVFKGAVKIAPLIYELASDLCDFSKEIDRYYSGQLTKRNLAISLSGVAGGIAGGLLGEKIGSTLGSIIGSFTIGSSLGSTIGGWLGGFIGYNLGSKFAKKIMSATTSKYNKTLQDEYYFNKLCNNIELNIKTKDWKPIAS